MSMPLQNSVNPYLQALLPELPPAFEAVKAQARHQRQPIVSSDAGWFMHLMTKMHNPHRILEVGCNIGYSALWVGSAMAPDAHIDTLEIDPAIAMQAEDNFRSVGLSDRIHIHVGAALDVIPTLWDGYDMVFIDAVKEEYMAYVEMILPKLNPGAIILVDNVLWGGSVTQPAQDQTTLALQHFNEYFVNHPALDAQILNIGDGIGLARLR